MPLPSYYINLGQGNDFSEFLQLLASILGALHSDACNQQEILTKLSLALVAFGLFISKDEGKLKAMLLNNPAFLAQNIKKVFCTVTLCLLNVLGH